MAPESRESWFIAAGDFCTKMINNLVMQLTSCIRLPDDYSSDLAAAYQASLRGLSDENTDSMGLLAAVFTGRESKARELLAMPWTNINAQYANGNTPLILAVQGGSDRLVRMLLDHPSIKVNMRGLDGYTALIRAVSEKPEVVAMLVARSDTDVNLATYYGTTALTYAIRCGNDEAVQLLLTRRDIDVNFQAVSDQQSKASSWATKYLKALDEEVTLSYHERLLEAPLDILIVVVTVQRSEKSYLRRVVASLDRQMKQLRPGEDVRVGLTLCNAQEKPEKHEDLLWLRRLFPTFVLNEEGTRTAYKNVRAKETDDYRRCLGWAHRQEGPEFVLLLQDDAELLDGALENLGELARKLSRWNDWIFVKVFYPDIYKGFSLNWRTMLELCILCPGVALAILGLLRLHRRARAHFLLLWSLLSLLVLVQLLALDRQHSVLPLLKRFFPFALSMAPGSCASAILYPRSRVSSILAYLEKEAGVLGGQPIDILLRDFLLLPRYQGKGFLAQGDFFRHIGYYSSLHSQPKANAKEFYIQPRWWPWDNEDFSSS